MGYHLPSLRLCNFSSFFFFFFSCCCCFSILMINPTSSSSSGAGAGAGGAGGQLVSSICKNTTDYKFCVESLYSDPRTPIADAYVLAYVSFDLAYLNATRTKAYIQDVLLKNTTAPGSSPQYSQLLKRCDRCYGEAVSALAQSLNDLDSETYSELAPSAGVAARKAHDCEAAFQGSHSPSPLSRMNHDLRALSKICIVVSNLFTVTP